MTDALQGSRVVYLKARYTYQESGSDRIHIKTETGRTQGHSARLKILEILSQGEGQHASAEDIYKILLTHDEDIGVATIYRVLTQCEQAGLVKRHQFEGGRAVFEIAEGDHHDHIICVRCGVVKEFNDETIEPDSARSLKRPVSKWPNTT